MAPPSKQSSFIFRLLNQELPSFQTLPHDPKFRSSQGFTIMEVALAATVLALTLTGMIGVIESGTSTLDLSRKQTIAGQILHQEIDNLRLQSWATIVGYPQSPASTPMSIIPPPSTPAGSAYDPILANFSQQLAGNYNYPTFSSTLATSISFPYTVIRTVTPIAPTLLQVTFTISWTGLTGHIYLRSSTTYVTQYGINVSYQRS